MVIPYGFELILSVGNMLIGFLTIFLVTLLSRAH